MKRQTHRLLTLAAFAMAGLLFLQGATKVKQLLDRKADLQRILNLNNSKVGELLRENAKVKDQLDIAIRAKVRNVESVRVKPLLGPHVLLREAGAEGATTTDAQAGHPSLNECCVDWTDDHDRFHFYAADRRLTVSQVFRLDAFLSQGRRGRVLLKGSIFEVSPKTGEDIKEMRLQDVEIASWAPERPTWTAFAGVSMTSEGSFVPTFVLSRRLFWNVYASGQIYGSSASATIGMSWAF